MKWLHISLICVFILFLMFLPIKLRGKIIYNIFTNQGILSVFFYKIKVFIAGVKFLPFKLRFETKKRSFYVFLSKSDNDGVSFGDIFFDKLLRKMKISNVRFLGRVGLIGDCYLSSILCGTFQVASTIFESFLNFKNPTYNGYTKFSPDYDNSRILFCVTISIKISIFLILKCLIISLFIKNDSKETATKSQKT